MSQTTTGEFTITTTTNPTPAATAANWKAIVTQKQEECKRKIPPAWLLPESITSALKWPLDTNPNKLLELDIPRSSGILTKRELSITEDFTVGELLGKLAAGQLSSVEVTVAFSKRAAIAQQLTRCLTETFFEEAQKRAAELDERRARGEPLGPLHGLPISLKDTFHIKGQETNIGYVALVGSVQTSNSALVDILLELGAVLYVKTNIPQTLMTADSDNHVYMDEISTLTIRRSTLADRAAAKEHSSASADHYLEIPALCCGIYGFKPSTARIPYGGQARSELPRLGQMLAVDGPLAKDFDSLEFFFKTVLDAEPTRFDSTALHAPFRSNAQLLASKDGKLTVGILAEDPVYPLQPPVKRIINEAVTKLLAAGHRIVQLNAAECQIDGANEIAMEIFRLEASVLTNMIAQGGEPPVPSVAALYGSSPPDRFRHIAGIENLQGLHRQAFLNLKRHQVKEAWRKIWIDNKLDVVLGPGAQNTAVRHDTYGWAPYTCLLNVLEYPAVVIPFSSASKSKEPEHFTMPERTAGPDYVPDLVDGAPGSVQLFAPAMRDEECLLAAHIVDECLRER